MFSLIKKLYQRLQWRRKMARYNDFTIAEYFRQLGAQVGDDCRIQIRSLGSEPWLVRIGNHCTIGSNVCFTTHDGGTWVFTQEHPGLQSFGTIDIRDNCFIGYGAILLPGIKIGPNAIVGAGAVVTKDVEPNTIVGGIPARKISSLADYKQRVLAQWEQQRPAGYLEDLTNNKKCSAAYIQQRKQQEQHLLKKHLVQRLWKSS